ncbi:MAG: hypothetical protein Q9197_002223 [Variospora fuerteventurae]
MGIGSKAWQDWVAEEDEGLEILKAAWDRGLSTWDTANVYSSGINEEIIGKAIRKFEIPREKLTILAKCFGTVPAEPGIFNWPFEPQLRSSRDYVNQGGLSRGAIFTAVDASLKRLGTDYIDLLQIHRYDATVPPEETMKALHDLVEAGKVRYIGASSMWAYQFARMQFIAERNGWTKFISMQNCYNLCYREEEREMNKFCNETGVGLIPWGPLFSGLLAQPLGVETARSKINIARSGGLTEADEAIIKRVEEMAAKKGWKMSQVALAWIRGKGCIPIDRRVKCDEAYPVCNRCKKSSLICGGLRNAGNWIFLDENVYAAGQRKRQRGPNVKKDYVTSDDYQRLSYNGRKAFSTSLEVDWVNAASPAESAGLSILPSLNTPPDELALTYYIRHHVEVSEKWPELADRWDSHMKSALADQYESQPRSVLSLAISAVSHATFGRAQRSHFASAAASTQYSRALVKANMALSDANEATQDDTLLAVMLLSFYENVALKTTSDSASQDMESMSARSFAHHDGAMAMLKLRRQQDQRTKCSFELDKLIRRQLMETLLLRSMPPPSWIQNGWQFGEDGYAHELDYCTVQAAKLRHQAKSLLSDRAHFTPVARPGKKGSLQSVLAQAETLNDVLIIWANQRPAHDGYRVHTVQDDERSKTGNRILDSTIHVYPSVGHAAMWNRYRAVRLIVHEVRLRISLELAKHAGADTRMLGQNAKQSIESVADDVCASIPYFLGLIGCERVAGHDVVVVKKAPPSLNMFVKASEASFLCWPLNELVMISEVPERLVGYAKDRLLDVSEIVDDGVMASIAANRFPTVQ